MGGVERWAFVIGAIFCIIILSQEIGKFRFSSIHPLESPLRTVVQALILRNSTQLER